jgi:hypothetical protein
MAHRPKQSLGNELGMMNLRMAHQNERRKSPGDYRLVTIASQS